MGLLEDALRAYAKYEDRTTDPSTPAAGQALVYVKDGALHSIDDAGAVATYGAGGGGAPTASTKVLRAAAQSIPNNLFWTAITSASRRTTAAGTRPAAPTGSPFRRR